MCALFSSALPHPFSAPLHPACLKHHPTSLPALSSVAASTDRTQQECRQPLVGNRCILVQVSKRTFKEFNRDCRLSVRYHELNRDTQAHKVTKS